MPNTFAHALPLVVSIEGNIGCGKTTVIKSLQKLFENNRRVAVLTEPVEEWEENGFLQAMYESRADPSSFQHMVLMSLAGDLLKKLHERDHVLIITERSARGNYQIFGKANLTPETVEHDMYKFTYDRVLGSFPPKMNESFIYLKTSTPTAKSRMKARGRAAEACVADSYLDKLGELHDRWLATEPDVTTIYTDNMGEEECFKHICMHLHLAMGNFVHKEPYFTDAQREALVSAMGAVACVMDPHPQKSPVRLH